jgi:hypothetical protein
VADQGGFCRPKRGGSNFKAKRVASMTPLEVGPKEVSKQREQIAPRKLKQRELDQREWQWLLRMEGSCKVWMAYSHQIMYIPNTKRPTERRVGCDKVLEKIQ